jgi:hypothetical protein
MSTQYRVVTKGGDSNQVYAGVTWEPTGTDDDQHQIYEATVDDGMESAFERTADQDVNVISYETI